MRAKTSRTFYEKDENFMDERETSMYHFRLIKIALRPWSVFWLFITQDDPRRTK